MLIRISLIIAIIAGLAAAALNFIKVKEKIDTVVSERNEWNRKFTETDAELTTTKGTLAKTEKELTQTKETLATTQQERDKAVAEADVQIKKATELTEKLAKTTTERDTAQANLAAYVATGFSPEQILGLGKQITKLQTTLDALQEEKKVLQFAYEKTKTELEYITGKIPYVTLKADLKGKILVADPKWEFVVLDVGQEQGAKVRGELLVSRDGRLVAKVIISDVQKDRCIANVMPGWKLADVLEGDQVIPAHPES
jgi:flagellar biosynthesis chaperone FliJ